MSHVFHRGLAGKAPRATSGSGVWVEDEAGRRYLDAAGGAIVVSVGHGRTEVADAMAAQASRLAYVHGAAFTTEAIEEYADELAPLLPMDAPRVYPVSGGSEAVETAMKLARAYHLARLQPARHKIVSRWGSYHGNSRGALDASGRIGLRTPYEPWLGRSPHVAAVNEFRCPFPSHPAGCGAAHAALLEELFEQEDPSTIAAFIAEPVGGATLGGAVPPDDYWPAVAEVCRRHGVLLIADEVMTGFGRTGRWFGIDHWQVRPDILVAGKGTAGGYWPLGLCVASGEVFEAVEPAGFVHGFTYSHHPVGAAVGRAVLALLKGEGLVEASAERGAQLRDELRARLADSPIVGDVRGLGLLVGVELVQDRSTAEPFERSERMTERVMAAARGHGLLLYSAAGCADGSRGDAVLLGPPLIISPEEVRLAAERTALAVAEVAEQLDGA
ncbi:MAG: aspartate aminotransferase family protein [Actinobacteria bacterium]|nr:aspartate aminotransferase family protein [Actinomycetota bacterium]